MSKRFSILLVVLTIVSGLIGGLISGRIFAVSSAQAVETKQSKVLTAEGLRIVDKNGKLLMKLGKESEDNSIDQLLQQYGLFVYDSHGDACLTTVWNGWSPYISLSHNNIDINKKRKVILTPEN